MRNAYLGSYGAGSPKFKQDGRLPPAYFAPYQFGKDAILKDENVCSAKKITLFLHHIF